MIKNYKTYWSAFFLFISLNATAQLRFFNSSESNIYLSTKYPNQEEYSSSDGYEEVGFIKVDTEEKTQPSEYIRKEYIFIGDERYECTRNLTLECGGFSINNMSVIFTKNPNGSSYVLLNLWHKYVVGTTLLYLDDGSIIKMYDRNRRDSFTEGHRKNNISIYYLTKDEVESIKKSNIASVRYNTSPYKENHPSNDQQGHLVHNKSCTAGAELGFGRAVDRIRFDVELSQLLN